MCALFFSHTSAVSPKVVFERVPRQDWDATWDNFAEENGDDLGGLGDVNEDFVVACMKWRMLPEEEKRRYASKFQQDSKACVKVLHKQYEAVQDPLNIPYLLEIYLSSSSDDGSTIAWNSGGIEREMLANLQALIEERNVANDEWNQAHDVDVIRSKMLDSIQRGSLKAPYRADFKQQLDEVVPEEYKTSDYTFKDWETNVLTDGMKQNLSDLLAPWRNWHLMREHAMLALIPLLPYFSRSQAERLDYVSCTFSRDYPLPVTAIGPWSFSATLLLEFQNDPAPFPNHEDSAMSDHGIQRLFACDIPKVIVQAMCTFVLDERVAPSPHNDIVTGDRVKVAQQYLVRFATEQPDAAHIVESTISPALENTIDLSKSTTDVIKRNRLALLGDRQVDLDFLNRGEIAKIVEVRMKAVTTQLCS